MSRSTEDRITVEWTSQPSSSDSLSKARLALSSSAAQIERAMRISSVWRRGLWLPRWSTFSFCIGSITLGEMRSISSGIPASLLSAFKSIAAYAPRREPVLPVMTVPSESAIEAAGLPVRSATSSAAGTSGRSEGLIPAFDISSSSLYIGSFPMVP